jgi:hypothetical protein
LSDILVGRGIDITCVAKDNPDLVLRDRLDRYGLNDVWSED